MMIKLYLQNALYVRFALMRTLEYVVTKDKEGFTAERFLRGSCGVSLALLRKLKRVERGLLRNGEHIRSIDILHEGDVVQINIPDDDRPAQASFLSVPVVYEDSDIIVFNKPANMPVHPTHNHQGDTLANAYAAHLAGHGEAAAFRPINRIDRDTTGLVLVCKHTLSAAKMRNRLNKVYYAICEGELSGCGRIDAPIRRCEGPGIKREVGEGGKQSITNWEVLESCNGVTLLRIILETGRTHQIRCHFADYMKMPLCGDDMYGGSRDRISRQALHCGELSFVHPMTDELITLRCDLPEDMSNLLS